MKKLYFHLEKLSISKLSLLVLIFSFFILVQSAKAQSSANYTFTTNSTGSLALDANSNTVDMSTGTTQLVGAASDATVSAVTNIGFNYFFMGNYYSQFSASADGLLGLGGTAVSGVVTSGGTTTTPKISACNADLYVGTSGKVHYKIIGAAPNRCLVVEWTGMAITYNTTAANANSTWQVRLYETTGALEYVYGFMNCTSTTYNPVYAGFSVNTTANNVASITYGTNAVSTGATFNTNTLVTGNIPNIHSTVDGSRRVYKFTPPVTAGPTGLSFSAVTNSGMTLNWTAAAPTTNIVKYVIFNSVNGGATYNYVANVALGTNTYVATGLSSSTVFDWKVIAISEGAESVSTLGTQATAAASTYYWVGTTGSTWNTPANWNTAADNTGTTRTVVSPTDILIVDGDGIIPGGSTTINVDLASFTIGQFKVTSNTNLTLQSNNATARVITIGGSLSDDFTIDNGSTLNLTNATNAVAFAFTGLGNTGLIAGTLNIGGAAANTFNSTGGTSTLVTVAATGVINNSFAGATGLTGSVASLSFLDGSAYNVSGATTGAPNVPLATWGTNATLTISGLTTSTSAPTNNNQSFGNIVINCPTLTGSYPFFTTTTTAVIKGNLTVTTGSGQFRTVSSGILTILGNVTVLAGKYSPFSGAGTVSVAGNTVIASGSIFDISLAAGTYLQRGATFTNNGTINGPNSATASNLYFFPVTPIAQTWNGTGTIGAALNTISLNNTSGLTISQTGPITILRANLFTGNITGSNNLTIGTGLALAGVIQVGSAGLTGPGGALLSAPTWNLGTGTFTLLYAQCDAYTTTNEIPPSRTVTNVSVINTNGVTLSGGNLEVSGTLTLTSGNFTTSAANLLSLGTATVPGTLTGGSATSYIKGPFARTIATANANTNYILYPVGKAAYAPISLAPATTSVAIMKAEAFDSNSGTADPSIISLAANRRWEAPLMSGTITNINVKQGDANLVTGNIPVQADSAAGIYASSFGSTATFAAGTPNTIQSNAVVLSANYTGFLSYANANTCSGTPAPGLTTATATTLCLGQSTTLGITSIPVGSGVTYQWQSSPDGVSYSDIVGATTLTYVATPTVTTYYQCNVTCNAGPSTGTSTPIQITFTNNVTGSTPGARCGTGSVTLGATPNSGATIKWYANASGGTSLGSGTTFNTPSISSTTTYYAESLTPMSGSGTIGTAVTLTGATAQPTAFCNRWPNYWSQTIYTAAELTAAGLLPGNITSMSYNISNSGDAATNANFTVKIGTVAGVSFASTTFLPTTAFTTVYGPSTYTHTASGLQTITFATPYVWDGVSNIVVNVTHDGANLTNNSQTYYTATSDNKVLWVNSYSGTTTTGTTSVNRLNVVFAGQVACSSPRVPVVATVNTPPVLTLSTATATICAGDSTSPVTITVGSTDYDTYVWSPSTGVTGNSTIGWTFNPSSTTAYTLTASQSGGILCSTTANVNVTVNPLPTAITITPASASICANTIQSLVATGGTANIVLLNENFNGVTNSWTTINNSTGGTPANSAWTLSPNNYTYASTPFSSNDASQFYLTNGDSQGVGGINNTILESPAFSTLNYIDATLKFYQYYRSNSGTAKVQFTTNGSTWVDLASYTTTDGAATGFVQKTIVLPAAALNQASVKIRFNYTDSYGWYWAVDNVNLTGNQSQPIVWSPITELYTDAAATIAYTGTPAATVYTKPTSTITYTATATLGSCPRSNTTVITVTPNSSLPTEVVSVCDTYTWSANGTVYTTSGTYTSTTSCVTRTLNLTITPSTSNTTTASACDSYTWAVNGTTYTSSGTYTSVTGCHTETLNLTITPSTSNTTTASACDAYHWAVNNTDYTSSGTYTYVSGCNTETLNLTITPSTSNTTTASACDSYTWAVNGTTYTSSGTYTSVTGCHTETLNLTITPSTTNTTTTSACDSYTWAVNGTTYTSSGTYTYVSGCNTETLNLTITPSTSNTTTASACDAYHWAVNNTDYTSSGTYTYVSGCHTETLNLTITPSTSNTTTASACDSYTWAVNGTTYTSSGTYTSVTGCHTETLNLTITPSTSNTTTASACDAYHWAVNNTDYTSSGTYTYVSGCHTETLNLTITPSTSNTTTASACDSYTWAVNGTTYTSSGTYTSVTGCHTETLNLTITPSTSNTTTASACDSYTWAVNGTTYTSSGTYTSVTGCHTETLNLTITVATISGATTQVLNGGVAADVTIEDIVVTSNGTVTWFASSSDAASNSNPLAAGTVLVNGNTYYGVTNIGSCRSTTLAVTVTVVLGIQSFDINELNYYPNPVIEMFNVSYNKNITNIEIFDLSGRMVKSIQPNTDMVEINLRDLSSAMYIVKLRSEDNEQAEIKIVKK